MGVETEAGYTWTDGTHARILHGGNKVPMMTITPSEGTNGDAVDNGLTYEKWIVQENALSDPLDLNGAAWDAATNGTKGSDGQTFTEDTSLGTHFVRNDITFAAVAYVVAVKLERQTLEAVRLTADDGTNTFSINIGLNSGSILSTAGTGTISSSQIVDLGDGVFEASMVFSASAGAGNVSIYGLESESSTTNSYTGTSRSVKILRTTVHDFNATVTFNPFGSQSITCCGIAAHNLGTSGTRVTVAHDADDNGTYTTIAQFTPTDDSPILIFFDAVDSPNWRITLANGVLPEVGVLWWGNPLKMERPLYGGHAPLHMARQTVMRSNYSETGEFLGRTKQRTYNNTSFAWQHLTAAWVRTNWRPFQQAMETEPFFIAWRPEDFSEVGFCQVDSIPIPQNMGIRDLMSVEMTVRGRGYD